MDNWGSLKAECAACRACSLCMGRNNLVFGVGNENSDLMFIGEGPGEQEDLQGEPFVGPAGKLLDDMLEMIDLDRSKIYIANMVKCRPPRNRDPQASEIAACRPWLERQIALVNPRLIVCLGRIAAMSLIREDFRITREHGQWFERNGRRFLYASDTGMYCEENYEFLKGKKIWTEYKCYGEKGQLHMAHVCHVDMNLKEARLINRDEADFFWRMME